MRKNIPIAVKRKWLGEYENGKPMIAIATENKHETRTVKKALEDARRDRDARFARSELMKEALRSHQDVLKSELQRIMKDIALPNSDFAPLSWHDEDNSIFKATGEVDIKMYSLGVAQEAGRPALANTTLISLLRQHMRSDRLWKSLVQGDKTYGIHIQDRMALQRKTVSLLTQKTGYQIIVKPNKRPPFLYSYTAGPTIYKAALGKAMGEKVKSDLEDEIVADTRTGTVKHRNSILAEAPGNEIDCRNNILAAYNDLIESPEFQKVNNSYNNLSESTIKVRQAVEEISMLGYIPGNCNVCRRLGM